MEVVKIGIKFDIKSYTFTWHNVLKTFKNELGFRYFTQYYDSALMKIILNSTSLDVGKNKSKNVR